MGSRSIIHKIKLRNENMVSTTQYAQYVFWFIFFPSSLYTVGIYTQIFCCSVSSVLFRNCIDFESEAKQTLNSYQLNHDNCFPITMCCTYASTLCCDHTAHFCSALPCPALAMGCIGCTAHIWCKHMVYCAHISIHFSGLINDPTSVHLILEDIAHFAVD